ncbi:MAG: hypothetical protein WGN25_01135 [Candidatus Electrothrix sp. GW3-4]|uniref:hypothetical protein n=1 Tax=Candidatus Electrothrix sp. GW3-4 TaxID=3126740 RepID=UPI0030CAB155
MLTGSIPKLLKEARQVKEALEKIGPGLPESITVAEIERRIAALEAKVSAIDAVNADKTRLVNEKNADAGSLSDFIVRARSGVLSVFGKDSSEYDMVGCVRLSERKKGKRRNGEGSE